MFFIFLPLNYIFGISAETSTLASTTVMNITGMVFQGLLLEYIGRKFQNLRHDLPTAQTIYLILLAVFIAAATTIAGDFTFAVSDEAYVLQSTFYCALFSVVGMTVTVPIFALYDFRLIKTFLVATVILSAFTMSIGLI